MMLIYHPLEISFPAISFGAIDCSDISTSENALKALKQIDAQKNGLYDSISQISAAESRYSLMIDQMDRQGSTLSMHMEELAILMSLGNQPL